MPTPSVKITVTMPIELLVAIYNSKKDWQTFEMRFQELLIIGTALGTGDNPKQKNQTRNKDDR